MRRQGCVLVVRLDLPAVTSLWIWLSVVAALHGSEHPGSESCPCISPVEAGKIPSDGASVMYGDTPLTKNLGAECLNEEEWWIASGRPDKYISQQCVGDNAEKPAWCYSAWCYVDPCNCAMNDVLQTLVWATLYPDTATKLAWSYLTCARCGSRKTKAQCAGHTACTWNTELDWCEPTASEAYVAEQCSQKDLFSCGGASNMNCVYDDGRCIPQSQEEVEKAWDCSRSAMGSRLCRCISPLSVGQLPPSALVRSSATNNSKLLWLNPATNRKTLLPKDYGSKCVDWDNVDVSGIAPEWGTCAGEDKPDYCFDAWCYVDPCTCYLDPSDATQTGVWFQPFPETAQLLAYSYSTCARCHNRRTQEECLRYTTCRWNEFQSLCYSVLTDDYAQNSCGARSLDECGGDANLNCKKEGESCVAANLEKFWDCSKFQQWPQTLMPPPSGSSPASTSIGQMLYFFGGTEDELWSFDLASKMWAPIATDVSPEVRSGCMLKGNRRTRMLYLFGGVTASGKFLNDLWAFDVKLQVWIDLTPDPRQPTPEPRARVAMHVAQNGLVVFGGHTATQLLNDLWYFDFQTSLWSYVISAGERVEPCAAAQFVDFDDESVLLVFGTLYPIAKGELDTVFQLSLSKTQFGRWFQPILEKDPIWGSPTGRYLSAIVPVPGNNSVVVAMGYSSELGRSFQDVWWLRSTGTRMLSWKRILPEDPRWIDSPAYRETAPETHAWTGTNGLVVGDKLVLGPGWSEPGVSNSLRTFDIGHNAERSALLSTECHSHDPSKTWDELPTHCRFHLLKDVPSVDVPPARSFASAVVQFGKMFLFGGLSDDDRPLADLWAYDLTGNSYGWSALSDEAEKNQKEGIPQGRYKFVMVTWRMQIILGGGCSDRLCMVRLDDWWLLDPSFMLYNSLPPAPLKLSEACALSTGPYVYVYGGQAGSGAFSSFLLRLEVVRRTWTQFAEAPSDFARAGCAMGLSPSGKTLFAVLGRLGGDTYMDGVAFDLTAIEESMSGNSTPGTRGSNSKSVSFQSKANIARADMSSIALPTKGELILLGGKSWNLYPVPSDMQLVVLSLGQEGNKSSQRLLQSGRQVKSGRQLIATDVNVAIVPKCPKLEFCYSPPATKSKIGFQLVGQTSVHYGDQLVIFGGENGPEKSAQFLFLDWAAHLPCSEGTSQGGGPQAPCEPCTPGTYSNDLDAVACEACPTGTANPLTGAQSLSACIPCAAGKYTDQTGSSECMPCPEDTTCPIGSIQPQDRVSQVAFGQPLPVQPPKLKRSSGWVSTAIALIIYAFSIFIAGFICCLVMSTCILGTSKTSAVLKKFDILVSGFVSDPASGVKVTTAGGGVLTIFFVLAMIVAFCPLMLGFCFDNVRESEGLIPTMKVKSSYGVELIFDVDVKASLKGYSVSAECATENGGCSSTIMVSHDGYDVPRTELSCKLVQDIAPACEVKWACRDCAFSQSLASLTITFDDRFAQGYELEVETLAGSSIPNSDECSLFQIEPLCQPKPAKEQAKSGQTIYFRAASASVFRGPVPAMLRFLAVPSIYNFDDKYSDETSTGLHLFIDSFKKGSEVGPEEISKVQGVTFVLELQRGNQAMIIERSLAKKIEELFGEGGGLFGSLMGTMGTIACLVFAWYAMALKHSPQKRQYLRISVQLAEARNLKRFGKTSRVSVECFIGTYKQVRMNESIDEGEEEMGGEFGSRSLPKDDAGQTRRQSVAGQRQSVAGQRTNSKEGPLHSIDEKKASVHHVHVPHVHLPKQKVDPAAPKRLDVDDQGTSDPGDPDKVMHTSKVSDKVGPKWKEHLLFYVTNSDLEDPTDIKKIPLYVRFVLMDSDMDMPLAKTQYVLMRDEHHLIHEDSRIYEAPLVGMAKRQGAKKKGKKEKETIGSLIARTQVFLEECGSEENPKEKVAEARIEETERRCFELAREDATTEIRDHFVELETEVTRLRNEMNDVLKTMGALPVAAGDSPCGSLAAYFSSASSSSASCLRPFCNVQQIPFADSSEKPPHVINAANPPIPVMPGLQNSMNSSDSFQTNRGAFANFGSQFGCSGQDFACDVSWPEGAGEETEWQAPSHVRGPSDRVMANPIDHIVSPLVTPQNNIQNIQNTQNIQNNYILNRA